MLFQRYRFAWIFVLSVAIGCRSNAIDASPRSDNENTSAVTSDLQLPATIDDQRAAGQQHSENPFEGLQFANDSNLYHTFAGTVTTVSFTSTHVTLHRTLSPDVWYHPQLGHIEFKSANNITAEEMRISHDEFDNLKRGHRLLGIQPEDKFANSGIVIVRDSAGHGWVSEASLNRACLYHPGDKVKIATSTYEYAGTTARFTFPKGTLHFNYPLYELKAKIVDAFTLSLDNVEWRRQ